ncbi:prolipoprotein diacylglyceryl transferase [Moraxella macacae 0408225]|uniref:Phosphatidylglycerol--prolipoprotein diacylglyceryl transferase n=1 Tax=Moraxella macacae 0408225 TaxID=1230338 RepID=L2F8T5_9GAMM|nr:prolipoprotein diacylglyceryl transferase [Moraxella macacae]ELA09161.1 prolipoprotein diacylglyceryl transferase [Moraxella macacae 0408225]
MSTIHPQFNPVAVDLGILQVHWYGLMYLLAFAVAYGLAIWRSKNRSDWSTDMVSDLVFYGAMGVILGGRVGYVLFYQFGEFLANPLYLLKINEGGMSFHGGFLGVAIAMLFFAKKYKKPVFNVLDFIVPCVPTGLLFGRIGNFINGELWGRVSDGGYNWLMAFPQAYQADRALLHQNPSLQNLVINVGEYALLPRHPSQLYQAFSEGVVLFVLIWWFASRPRPRMAATGLFVLGYGVVRFITEFFRQPDADQGFIVLGWVTKGQLLSLPMVLVGLFLIIWAYKQQIYDWGKLKNVD